MSETITITAPATTTGHDDGGMPTQDEPVESTAVIKAFAPRSTSEDATTEGTRAITGGVVYGYRGTEIPKDAVLTIRGVDYSLDGEIGDWLSPYGPYPQGVEFNVKRAG